MGQRVFSFILFIGLLASFETGYGQLDPLWLKSGGYDGYTIKLEYSPDGKYLVYGSLEKSMRIWDMENGNLVFYINEFEVAPKLLQRGQLNPGVCGLIFSKDGSNLFVSNYLTKIESWDTVSWRKINETKASLSSCKLKFSPNEKIIASNYYKDIDLYDRATLKKLTTLTGHTEPVVDFVFTPDNKKIISCGYGQDRTIRIWDVESGKMLHSFTHYTSAIDISSDGKYLASAAHTLPIKIWDLEQLKIIKEMKNKEEGVQSIKFSKDGTKLYAVSWQESFKIWDVQSGKKLKEITTKDYKAQKKYSEPFLKLAVHPDEKTIAIGDAKGRVRFFDLETSEEKKIVEGHYMYVPVVKYSPDGNLLASGSGDKTLKIWDSQSGKLLKHFQMYTETNGIAFSPDSKHLVAGGTSKTVFVFDVESLKLLHKLKGHTDIVSRIIYSPDGKEIVSSGVDNKIIFWDAQSGELKKTIATNYKINHFAFHPDGKTMAVTGEGKIIKFFDVATGNEIQSIVNKPNILWLAYSPDGKYLSAGCIDTKIRVFDPVKKKLLYTLSGHKRSLANVIYSQDGKKLYSTGWDGKICIWDMEKKGKLLYSKDLTYDAIYELNLHPDGKQIAFGSRDCIVGVLKLD